MKVHHHIKHHLKHLFIPHEGNEYRPHFFREISIAIILTIIFVIVSISASSAYVLQNTETGNSIVARVLIDLTNQNRVNNNLDLLTYNILLEKASALKAKDMADNGYFSHNSPIGLTPWYWFEKVGYDYEYAGENLAVNFTNSEDISNAWMNSPMHKANILSKSFKEIGISMHDTVYENRNTIFVVQMFGTQTEKDIVPDETVASENTETTPAVTKKVTPKLVPLKVLNPTTEVTVVATTTDGLFTETNSTTSTSTEVVSAAKTDNPEVKGEAVSNVPFKSYATPAEKTFFNSSKYASLTLIGIFVVVAMALLVMIFIEIEKQHPRHIIYGVMTLVILVISIYATRNIFQLDFILI